MATEWTEQDFTDLYLNGDIEFQEYFSYFEICRMNESKRKYSIRPKFTVNQFTDREFKLNFRFEKEQFIALRHAMKIPNDFYSHAGHHFSGTEALCVLLRRLSTPTRWFDLVKLFNRSETSLCKIFYAMLKYVSDKFDFLLNTTEHSWLSQNNLRRYADAIGAQGGCMPNVMYTK